MTEAGLLSLVVKCPHATALARHARGGSAIAALRRLEARGFVRRANDEYRLTHHGRNELELARALAHLLARTLQPAA